MSSFQALDLFRGKNYLVLMDSALDGQVSDEDRTELIHLASRCFRPEPAERPSIKFLMSALSRLEKRAELWPKLKEANILVSHGNINSSKVNKFFFFKTNSYAFMGINIGRLHHTLNLQQISHCA